MQRILPLLLALVLAGCAAAPAPNTPPSSAAPGSWMLQPLGQKTALTTPGKLASEFWVQPQPGNPLHLAMGRLEFDQKQEASTSGWRCVISTSLDGGRTWTDTARVFPDGSSDPWVAYEADGTLHAICNTAHYARSEDDGRTWQEGKVPTPGNDRPSILETSGGRLLHCASRPGTNEGPSIVYSDDSGTTWTQATASAQGDRWEQTMCNHMAQGPDGTLYAALGLSEFRMLVSHDGGASWQEGGRIALDDPRRDLYGQTVPTHQEGNMYPTFSVSPTTGHVFVGVQTFEQTPGLGSYHIEVYRSTDQGASFQALPLPSAPCPACDTTRASVHADGQGRLALLWRTSQLDLPFTTWFSASVDEGLTWLAPIQLSQEDLTQGSWNPGTIDGADHYWAMASTSDGLLAMWIDRSGEGRSQVWSELVQVVPAS